MDGTECRFGGLRNDVASAGNCFPCFVAATPLAAGTGQLLDYLSWSRAKHILCRLIVPLALVG